MRLDDYLTIGVNLTCSLKIAKRCLKMNHNCEANKKDPIACMQLSKRHATFQTDLEATRKVKLGTIILLVMISYFQILLRCLLPMIPIYL